MDKPIDNFKIQPISEELREALPVCYFLFTLMNENSDEKYVFNTITKSSFHKTDTYFTLPFYKTISNIF